MVLTLFVLNASGILLGQKQVAAPTSRYYRIIALVHLTGSGKAGDPILPEYVAQGTAVAQTAMATAIAASAPTQTGTGGTPAPTAGAGIVANAGTAQPVTGNQQPMPTPVSATAPPIARPGFLAWSMQKSDDGKMAIVHIVAADPGAFATILSDTRPEIRVFQIGKDSPQTIQAEMQKYRKDFNLATFEVPVQ